MYLSEEIAQEEKALAFYLRHHHTEPLKSEQLLQDTHGYQELLTPYFQIQSQELQKWAEEPYQSNPYFPEQLIHKSSSGRFVRSKSEAMIDHFLYTNRIPYRYEAPLQLGQQIIYPDFTIRHPRTGDIYYYEHFGKMDDPAYCKKTAMKIQLYSEHGIIPSIHLIMTFESLKHPLTTDTIQKTIEEYFL